MSKIYNSLKRVEGMRSRLNDVIETTFENSCVQIMLYFTNGRLTNQVPQKTSQLRRNSKSLSIPN